MMYVHGYITHMEYGFDQNQPTARIRIHVTEHMMTGDWETQPRVSNNYRITRHVTPFEIPHHGQIIRVPGPQNVELEAILTSDIQVKIAHDSMHGQKAIAAKLYCDQFELIGICDRHDFQYVMVQDVHYQELVENKKQKQKREKKLATKEVYVDIL